MFSPPTTTVITVIVLKEVKPSVATVSDVENSSVYN